MKQWAGDLDSYEFNAGVVKGKPNSGGTINDDKEVSEFGLAVHGDPV